MGEPPRKVARHTSDVASVKDFNGPSRDHKLLHTAVDRDKTWHRNCCLCLTSDDARHMTAISCDASRNIQRPANVQLTEPILWEIMRRYTSNNKGLLCDKCRRFANLVATVQVPLMLVVGLLLLIRRDCGRDFSVGWNGSTVKATSVTIQGYLVPVLEYKGLRYVSSNIIVRHGCKAHSCWDRRSKLLQERVVNLPVNASDATKLAYAKHYFGCGFKLDNESEAALATVVMSSRQVHNAESAMGCVEDLARYFSYSADESGPKAFLGIFAMMSLLVNPHTLESRTYFMLRRAVETWFTTSWGPAKCVNFMTQHRYLRDYSPQDLSRKTSSTRDRDKRLATVTFLILIHTQLGAMIAAIFKSVGVPYAYAACLSFLYCELRKYYAEHVTGYRRGFDDRATRNAFAEEVAKHGIDIGCWLNTDGLAEEFITAEEKEQPKKRKDM